MDKTKEIQMVGLEERFPQQQEQSEGMLEEPQELSEEMLEAVSGGGWLGEVILLLGRLARGTLLVKNT